jgi:hypothetical protein
MYVLFPFGNIPVAILSFDPSNNIEPPFAELKVGPFIKVPPSFRLLERTYSNDKSLTSVPDASPATIAHLSVEEHDTSDLINVQGPFLDVVEY